MTTTYTDVVLQDFDSGIVLTAQQATEGGSIDISSTIVDLGGRFVWDLILVVVDDDGSGMTPDGKTLVYPPGSLALGTSYNVVVSYNDATNEGMQIPATATVSFQVQSSFPDPGPMYAPTPIPERKIYTASAEETKQIFQDSWLIIGGIFLVLIIILMFV